MDDEFENYGDAVFVGPCTCDHDPEDHSWGACGDGCPCQAGWEE